MCGCGFQLNHLQLKCSSHARHSFAFILGLIIIHNIMLSSQASAVKCEFRDFSLNDQHCGIQPAGVHDLDCFGKYVSPGMKTCMWKPGNPSSEKTYTLIIKQQKKYYCKAHINITETSENITVHENYNMTAVVFENSESTNCTKAVFNGSPKHLLRCGPPYNVSFKRNSGRLVVAAGWKRVDKKAIKNYSVRYKALGDLQWSTSPVQSENGEKCTVQNLNSSLVFVVQIQCVTNRKCSQCVWSDAYTVPSELMEQPVITKIEDTDVARIKGRRLITLTWKFSAKELHDGYHVTIGKASGEPPYEWMTTTQPEIRLVLSYSAYLIQISAFNNASTSPAVNHTVPRREYGPDKGAKVNVTVQSKSSLTIYWEDDLISRYVCYSVEWMRRGHQGTFMSFYQNEINSRTLSPLPEPLEPYVRYSITLHTRPNKDTCNMKHINNSESTYGTTQFYFIEGSPVSAPANISTYNVTLSSAMLCWLSIPEEDIRGFLLGYTIHYSEYNLRGTETNITVDPLLNSYQLGNLKSGTTYEVQISGFTQAGAGVHSRESLITTNQHQGYFNLIGIITTSAVVAVLLIFASPIINRTKDFLWPSTPNPGNSNAIKKIDGSLEMEMIKSIKSLNVEEWDTNSLQILGKEELVLAGPLALMIPLLNSSEEEGVSVGVNSNWIPRDAEEAHGRNLPYVSAEKLTNIQDTGLQASTLNSPSGYTSMGMFQQAMSQPVSQQRETENLNVVQSGLDYVTQFRTSPILDNEVVTTIL